MGGRVTSVCHSQRIHERQTDLPLSHLFPSREFLGLLLSLSPYRKFVEDENVSILGIVTPNRRTVTGRVG